MPCCLLHHLPDEMLCPNIFIQLQMLINMEAITANVTSENAVINTGHMDHALTIRINSTRVNTAAYTAVTCCNNTTVSVYHDCVMSLNVFTRLISKCTTESNVAHFIFHFSPLLLLSQSIMKGRHTTFFFFFLIFLLPTCTWTCVRYYQGCAYTGAFCKCALENTMEQEEYGARTVTVNYGIENKIDRIT